MNHLAGALKNEPSPQDLTTYDCLVAQTHRSSIRHQDSIEPRVATQANLGALAPHIEKDVIPIQPPGQNNPGVAA